MDKTPKRRGRPPKPTSLCHRISSTMNININTPPHRSPTAESNSNQTKKRGTPNWMDPIMRVSPTLLPSTSTPRQRSRKNLSVSSTPSLKKQRVTPMEDYMAFTPLSVGSYPLRAGANIAMITQSDLQFRTPPATAVRPSFPSMNLAPAIAPRGSAGNFEGSPRSRSEELLGAPLEIPQKRSHSPPEQQQHLHQRAQSVQNVQESPQSPSLVMEPPKKAARVSRDFLLLLVVDLLGRAVLSLGQDVPPDFSSAPIPTPSARQRLVPESEPALTGRRPQLQYSYSAVAPDKPSFGFEMPFSEELAPAFDHQDENTRVALRRFNSDITGLASSVLENQKLASIAEPFVDVLPMEKLPQTPRRENYFLAPTGQSPNPVSFNLTPQFSSMMNSMMCSPHQQRKPVQGDFFGSSDLFHGSVAPQVYPTVNMMDLMTIDDQLAKNAPVGEMSGSSSPSGDDSGDARLALKKIIQVKRES